MRDRFRKRAGGVNKGERRGALVEWTALATPFFNINPVTIGSSILASGVLTANEK